MLVEEIMTKGVVAIGPEMPIGDAYILMEQRNVRHFPVLEVTHTEQAVMSNVTENDAKLVGIISDRDIRAVGSELPNATKGVTLKDPVRRIMVSPVLTAHPLDPIEESASVLREHKIGAMPVMDGEDLVGIVTSTDFLESLVTMTGVQSAFSATTRLEVEVENRPGALARLTAAVAERGGQYPEHPHPPAGRRNKRGDAQLCAESRYHRRARLGGRAQSAGLSYPLALGESA